MLSMFGLFGFLRGLRTFYQLLLGPIECPLKTKHISKTIIIIIIPPFVLYEFLHLHCLLSSDQWKANRCPPCPILLKGTATHLCRLFPTLPCCLIFIPAPSS